MQSDFVYVGDELEVFQHAAHWKRYWQRRILPYMGRRVLEVGAGMGASTQVFAGYDCAQWVALEPDPELVRILEARRDDRLLPTSCEIRTGTIAALGDEDQFDTVLYIDVLEHIEDDRGEIEAVAQHLTPNGHLIVLSPAFQFLFTPFDEQIGHYRRYVKKTLAALTPNTCQTVDIFYLDAVGMLASLANLLFLRSPSPSLGQIRFWDRYMVPVSRVVDRCVNYQFGRSIVGVWQKLD